MSRLSLHADRMRFSTMQVSKKLSRLSTTQLSDDARRASIATALHYASVFSPDEGVLFEVRDTAASPSRDYYQLRVGRDKVSLIRWCVSNAMSHPSTAPAEDSYSFEEFVHETKLHEEIIKLFGQATLDHTERIVLGEWDFLPRIPEKALKKILLMLDLKDLVALGLTCKKLLEICSQDPLWKILYRRYSPAPPNEDDRKVVGKLGWKKLFFINNRKLAQAAMRGEKIIPTAAKASSGQVAKPRVTKEKKPNAVKSKDAVPGKSGSRTKPPNTRQRYY